MGQSENTHPGLSHCRGGQFFFSHRVPRPVVRLVEHRNYDGVRKIDGRHHNHSNLQHDHDVERRSVPVRHPLRGTVQSGHPVRDGNDAPNGKIVRYGGLFQFLHGAWRIQHSGHFHRCGSFAAHPEIIRVKGFSFRHSAHGIHWTRAFKTDGASRICSMSFGPGLNAD